jgi:hypothetical protein
MDYGLPFFSPFYSLPPPPPLRHPYTIDRRPSSQKELLAIPCSSPFVYIYTHAHSILKCPLCFTCSPAVRIYTVCFNIASVSPLAGIKKIYRVCMGETHESAIIHARVNVSVFVPLRYVKTASEYLHLY